MYLTFLLQLAGLAFDMAIRLYLESFRLPGEAQKINRIMESFGKHYHEQCPDLFKNADAVYILGYSVILLNTDQHNVGVGTRSSARLAANRHALQKCSGCCCAEPIPSLHKKLPSPCLTLQQNLP